MGSITKGNGTSNGLGKFHDPCTASLPVVKMAVTGFLGSTVLNERDATERLAVVKRNVSATLDALASEGVGLSQRRDLDQREPIAGDHVREVRFDLAAELRCRRFGFAYLPGATICMSRRNVRRSAHKCARLGEQREVPATIRAVNARRGNQQIWSAATLAQSDERPGAPTSWVVNPRGHQTVR